MGSIVDPLSLNLYSYVSNNPIKYIDPTGHWQQGDSNRSEAAQAQILEATKEYSDAAKRGDKAAMNTAHQKAEDERDGKIYKDTAVTKKEIEKEIDAIMDSKYVSKSAKKDLNYSEMSVVTEKTNSVYEKKEQQEILDRINSARKNSNVLEPPKGTVGLPSDKKSASTRGIESPKVPNVVEPKVLPIISATSVALQYTATEGIKLSTILARTKGAGVVAAAVYVFTPDVISYGDLTEAEVEANRAKNEEKNKTNRKDQRFYGKPGDVNTEGNTETKIGPDGRAETERHNTTHGNPKIHSSPHDHDVTWDENGKPIFSKPRNYWDNPAPPLK